ncbi:MAG: endopeptidase La [Candidatus Enteromonas sp.]|jgi:ATP-dependent Lon protease|nr:endopeptidase La [Bacilli bacterium]MEE3299254.1 endopeptidase La [Candidatus Enteromonas sp.]MEE3426828.1 endopeptidase La [Candidatus Enteromonas sp.]MEE3431314.1 endopeptidase La [Candidatus Enteromonas sp.]MEE3442758.1 endopeptidase La [Candidatus Enteromonas sp.]
MNEETMTPQKKTLSLPLLITRGLIVFPNMGETIEVGRAFSMAAVDEAKANTNSLIFVVAQRDAQKEDPAEEDLFAYGTLCRIINYVNGTNSYRIRVVGSKRVHFLSFKEERGVKMAEAEIVEDVVTDRNEEVRLVKEIISAIENSPAIGREIPRSAIATITKGVDSATLADNLAGYLPITIEEKEAILEEASVSERLKKLLSILSAAKSMAEVDQNISEKVRINSEKAQKEYFLREKMKAIKEELGEGKDDEHGPDAIKSKLEKNPYPENVKAKVKRELKRFEMMPESSLEASLIMSYIDTLLAAPWYQKTEDNDDLNNVRKILDEDHFGLEKVKKRIIEYLAVKKMTGNLKAPILCFYGPPGTGKTSLAKSIARALDRKFFKASLGGVSDESEIRGHRRTYVGSMPGRIIQGMTKSGVTNPVFLLDEIDKVGGSSLHGDPSSALLEVLDPEQNFAFNDNFIEEPYDLSNVLFIATANYLENVPAPLRDRLELIEVPSYTELEKIKIATGFLVPKEMKANGLAEGDIVFEEEAIKEIIEHYTMEAGVRNLERLIASICRKAVVDILSNPETKKPVVITVEKAIEYLGVEIFEGSKKEKENQIGVVTGLAYTEFGGDILPIEVTYFPGKGGLVLTGKLGDVMKESATIALDYVRANAKKYHIDDEIFQKNDIHIHVPEGAVPKDGPSAGVAITTAIISCLSHTPVNANVAMTGEVTLRGKALAIGGLREKSLAALRSGIKEIIVPIDNKKDVSELPEEVKKTLKINFMTCVDDALAIALVHPEA